MGIHAANNASDAAPDADDISIIPQVDLPTRNDAFTALGRAPPKKSIMEQIRDAETHTSTSLDASSYPKIVGPDKRKYYLRSHFHDKERPSWVNAHGSLLLRLALGGLGDTDGTVWVCHRCQKLFDTGATTSVAKHLKGRSPGLPRGRAAGQHHGQEINSFDRGSRTVSIQQKS